MAVLGSKPDRRAAVRLPPSEVSGIRDITIASETVTVINLSPGGLLIDCGTRLAPQRPIRIKVNDVWVRCRVVRCHVSSISPESVRYQAALTFDSPQDIVGLAPVLNAA